MIGLTKMKPEAKELYKTALTANMEIQSRFNELKPVIESGGMFSIEEKVDLLYSVEQMLDILEDAKKHCRAMVSTLQKIICLQYALQSVTGEPVRTDYVTASPMVNNSPRIPSRKTEPEAYKALMDALGINEEVYNNDMVRPHWPGFVDFVQMKQLEGVALPDHVKEIMKPSPIYSVTLRKKKGVLDDEQNATEF